MGVLWKSNEMKILVGSIASDIVSTKTELTLKKFLLCVWWDSEGKRKRKINLLHDNGKPQVLKDTRQTIEDLGLEVLSHPPYSPNIAFSE